MLDRLTQLDLALFKSFLELFVPNLLAHSLLDSLCRVGHICLLERVVLLREAGNLPVILLSVLVDCLARLLAEGGIVFVDRAVRTEERADVALESLVNLASTLVLFNLVAEGPLCLH